MSSIEPAVVLPPKAPGEGSVRKRALRFGTLFGFVLAGLGLLLLRRHAHHVLGLGLLVVAVSVFALSVVSPRGALAVEAAWLRFASLLGRVNGAIVLTVLYVVLVTPLGLLFRLFNRRSFDAARTGSTFVSRRADRDPKHFERPY
jgi:ABC-type Fe3+-siderophore transport system permease subunit